MRSFDEHVSAQKRSTQAYIEENRQTAEKTTETFAVKDWMPRPSWKLSLRSLHEKLVGRGTFLTVDGN